jgi:very-short-patch-repair endonuclease
MREGQKRDFARTLRRNSTDAEQIMWRRLSRIKFRRQIPIGPYIADFASIQYRIIVELDGSQHAESTTDPKRDAFLAADGWRILRFWNNDVTQNRNGVLESILQAVALTRLGPEGTPHPHPQAGEG